MRDPFLLSIRDEKVLSSNAKFWLYGTTDKPPDSLSNPYAEFPGTGFNCYCSNDLKKWNGPFPAFRKPDKFWADTQFWAPEVYVYDGRLVMFASMKKTGTNNERGVAILESTSGNPAGPFVPLKNSPITPPSWACLDGTLHVENGRPFMVFCREWTQLGDGQMCAIELSKDLLSAVGKPVTLFSASQAPWSKSFVSASSTHNSNFITDGPFLHRCASSGELVMLWSSIGTNDKYCVGIARSTSGRVVGPWVHDKNPLFNRDGGHAMIASIGCEREHSTVTKTKPEHYILLLALHTPNRQLRRSHPELFGILEEREQTTGLAKFSLFDFL